MKSLSFVLMCLVAFASIGCSFHARSAEDYRKDTRALLESRNSDIKSCYDAALKADPKVSGVVVVKFTVEAETGNILNPQSVAGRTSAPESVTQCVITAISGLSLQPPDAREGDAEYTWEFEVNQT